MSTVGESNSSFVKYSKKEAEAIAKAPDKLSVVLNSLLMLAQKNKATLVFVVAAFLVVGGGLAVRNSLSLKKESELQAKFAVAEKDQAEREQSFLLADKETDSTKKSEQNSRVKPVRSTGNLDLDYGSSVKVYSALIAEDPSTKASRMAAIKLSDLYLKYGKSEEALKVLSIVTGKLQNDLTSQLATFQRANVQSQMGQCKEAVEGWLALIAQKDAKFLHQESRLRIGLCYESMNELAKAEQFYQEAAKTDDKSDIGPTKDAEKYLRLMKAKSKGS